MKSILLKCSIFAIGLLLTACAGTKPGAPTGGRIADQSAQTKAALSSYPLKTNPVSADTFIISDTEASNATKRVTMGTVAFALSNFGLQLGELADLQILDTGSTYTNLVDDAVTYGGTYDAKHVWSIDKVGAELAAKAPTTSPTFSTSLALPQGASPTVDAAGEIAVDTTSDQLIYYGAAKRVLTHKKQFDFAVKTPVDADDVLLFKSQTAITITDIHVIAQGGTSISVDIQECNSSGASCATVDAAITADTDGAEDDGTLSNGTIDAGDWVKMVLGAPSGTVNYLTGSIYYVETAD